MLASRPLVKGTKTQGTIELVSSLFHLLISKTTVSSVFSVSYKFTAICAGHIDTVRS